MGANSNIVTFSEQVEAEFLRLYEKYKVAEAPERRRADIIDSFWSDIYKLVFQPLPDEIRHNNLKSRLKPSNVFEVEEVTQMYINLCKRYGGVVKFNQFANLTGFNRYTLYLWHNDNTSGNYIFNLSDNAMREEYKVLYIIINGDSVEYVDYNKYYNNHSENGGGLNKARFDVIKKLQEEMQDSNTNGLSCDTMGHSVRANNEQELGKLYEPRRMVTQEQIKQGNFSGAMLPKLSINPAQLPVSDQSPD
jgi:hypothetical protein